MLLSLLLLASSRAATTPPNTVVCNDNSYGTNGAFAASLAEVLKELVWVAPWAAGDVYQSLPSEAPIVFGHAACRRGLGGETCKLCLDYAVTQMQQMCGNRNSTGGRAATDDCFVRYENYAFRD
ncbi:unnamed protein product [Urochloa humidicola]